MLYYLQRPATWTVVLTVDASESLAYVIQVGLENSVRQNSVTLDAVTMDNAKTELVYAFLVGTEDIVLWKVVREVVPVMDNVESLTMDIGNANASMDGMDLIALRLKNKYVMMAKIMIKV